MYDRINRVKERIVQYDYPSPWDKSSGVNGMCR